MEKFRWVMLQGFLARCDRTVIQRERRFELTQAALVVRVIEAQSADRGPDPKVLWRPLQLGQPTSEPVEQKVRGVVVARTEPIDQIDRRQRILAIIEQSVSLIFLSEHWLLETTQPARKARRIASELRVSVPATQEVMKQWASIAKPSATQVNIL